MSKIQIGCQSYAWQMSGEKFIGRLDHIIGTVGQAGFAGVEAETQFLVGKFSDPLYLKDLLQAHKLELAAITLVEDWLDPVENTRERENADWAVGFLSSFPSTRLGLCQMPGKDRANLRQRQLNLLACVNTISRRASQSGIVCTYHPNSPPGSIFRTAEDYQILLNGLDASVLGYTPDVGHIANGGMDPLAVIREYRTLVNHVHFKDYAGPGEWAAMGEGLIDFPGIVTFLHQTGYAGWLIVEDECEQARLDPDQVTLQDGFYTHQKLLPLV
jgi:inosose dehydratase